MPSKKKNMRRTSHIRKGRETKEEHSTGELYLHGLAGIVGLGILVIPAIIAAVYGAFSVYLVIASGFIALMVGVLIYDISLTHDRDPYNFLKDTSGKEYSFIFGFLMTITFIIIVVAAGIASVEELSLYFGLSIYDAIGIVDLAFLVMWGLLIYRHERTTMNIAGGVKILFLALLIAVGVGSVLAYGTNIISASQTSSSSAYSFIPIATSIILFLWMYGGFESVSMVYKGEDRSKVARALIYVMFSVIVLFAIVQLLVYLLGGNALNQTLSVVSEFTSNIISGRIGGLAQNLIVGLSIFVILTVAFSVANSANNTLDNMAKDKIMPKFLIGNPNLKSLISIVVPLVLVTVFSYPITSSQYSPFEYISIVVLSAIVFVSAFVFFSVGYAVHYASKKKYSRMLFGVALTIILLAFILTMPWPFLLGLIIIMLVALLGYALLK